MCIRDSPEIDYQDIIYYAAPRHKTSGDGTIDPEIEKTFDKLGIPLHERAMLSGNMAAVSYTHLDVYKRQAFSKESLAECPRTKAMLTDYGFDNLAPSKRCV